jgi:hypothetical protein
MGREEYENKLTEGDGWIRWCIGQGQRDITDEFRGVGEKRKVIHYNTYVLYTRRVMKGGRAAYRPAEFRKQRGHSC